MNLDLHLNVLKEVRFGAITSLMSSKSFIISICVALSSFECIFSMLLMYSKSGNYKLAELKSVTNFMLFAFKF